MENRFGFKDLVLSVLLVGVIVVVVLAMKQYDRQWEAIQLISRRLQEQSEDLQVIRRQVENGAAMRSRPAETQPNGSATTGSSADALTDPQGPFGRILAARAKPDFAEGGWLLDAFPGGVAKLTPLLSGDAYADLVQGSVLESLATRDPDTLEWQPLLARSWQVKDNRTQWEAYVTPRLQVPLTADEVKAEPDFPKDKDASAQQKYVGDRLKQGRRVDDVVKEKDCPPGMFITFQLREGVVFSDGRPLTADDVVFSHEFTMNEEINAPRARAYYSKIREVRKQGPYEVTFVFAEPYFEAFGMAGGMAILPRHFYSKFTPQQFNDSVGLLLGSGPYRLEDPAGWKPGQLIKLVRNERYWGVRSGYDVLVYKEMSNDMGRLTEFRNGDLDLLGAPAEQYRELLKDQALVERTQHFEYFSPLGGYGFIAWNQRRNGQPTRFADRRVRQAMTMLTDRQRMIQEIMFGYAVQATGPFSPMSKQYNPQVQPWPYDVERARQLLAEAGFKPGADGVLRGPDGEPFRFKFTYPSGSANYERRVLFLKDSYARAGIVLEPDPLEWAVFTQRLENKNFEAISLGWTAGVENDIHQMFHSSQMGAGGDDFMSYRNPELDRLIDEARRTLDEPKRIELWRRCHQIIHEDQPYTFLWFGKSLRFMAQRVHNAQVVKLGMNPREEWFSPRPLQRVVR